MKRVDHDLRQNGIAAIATLAGVTRSWVERNASCLLLLSRVVRIKKRIAGRLLAENLPACGSFWNRYEWEDGITQHFHWVCLYTWLNCSTFASSWGICDSQWWNLKTFLEDACSTCLYYLATLSFGVRETYAWFHNVCFDSLFESSNQTLSSRYGHVPFRPWTFNIVAQDDAHYWGLVRGPYVEK